MCGMTSIYKEDSMEDPAMVTARAMQSSTERISVIDRVEVFTQDTEFDLSDIELE